MEDFVFHILFLLGGLSVLIYVLMKLSKEDYWEKRRFIPLIIALLIFILLMINLSPMPASEIVRNSLIFFGSAFTAWLILVASEFET